MAKPSENLINLCRASVEAQAQALSDTYSREGWAPWLAAAEAFQQAVTAEAEATGESRLGLEQAAKKAVLHPEPDKD